MQLAPGGLEGAGARADGEKRCPGGAVGISLRLRTAQRAIVYDEAATAPSPTKIAPEV